MSTEKNDEHGSSTSDDSENHFFLFMLLQLDDYDNSAATIASQPKGLLTLAR